MRILHVTKKYPNALGGDAIVVSNLEREQIANGDEVYILTTNCDDIINKKNLIKFGLKDKSKNLDNITLKRIISLKMLYFMSFDVIRKIKPDVVHTHSVDLGYALSFACRKYKFPMINTCHGVSFNDKQYPFFKRKAEIFFLKHSKFKKIITVDPTTLNSFNQEHIDDTVYVPNGVNLKEFDNKIKKKKNKITKILFVGRLEKQKGINYLITAAGLLVKDVNNFEIIIVGNGSELINLKNEVKDNNLSDKIKFVGSKNREELIKYYYSSDIFVLPSIWEGFPLTLLEAWAAKLPVVITDVGGIPEICKNNENALIIPARNPKALAESILKIYSAPKLAKKMGENGRKLVEKKYNWKIITEQINKLYQEILE